MPSANRTGLAIVLSLSALALFDAMGLVIKLLSDRYSAQELSAWRNLFGLIPSLLAIGLSRVWHDAGRPVVIRQWRLAITRGLIVAGAQLSYYLSLGLMAFATATTITYANALFMTALAVPLLRERVGWIRWSAVLIGFAGVVLVMQPGADTFSLTSLLPLGAAFLYALVGVTSRLFDDDVPSAVVSLYSSVAAAFASFAVALLWGGFTPVATWSDMGWIMAMGGFGGTAVLLLVVSYRMTEQSNLAPFSYFGIPFAFVFGWVFFGETPWDALFPGAMLIIVGGLLVVWRERRLSQQTKDAALKSRPAAAPHLVDPSGKR